MACTSSEKSAVGEEIPGTQVMMDFMRTSFYSAPFPSEDLRRPDGSIDITGFPNPDSVDFVEQLLATIGTEVKGFSCSSGIFFRLTGMIRSDNLPDVHTSILDQSLIFLVSVDLNSPDYLMRYPVDVYFTDDGGPFGAADLLSLLPLQGIPLRPETTYAAVVLRSVLDIDGNQLGVSLTMAQLTAGERPASLSQEVFDKYTAALAALSEAGTDSSDIAGLAVFITDAPTRRFELFREDVLSRPYPEPNSDFVLNEVFDDFCVYESTIDMPVYQSGRPPFSNKGGGWVVDESGKPVLQTFEEANFVVTIPRKEMPAAGFPVVVFVHTGGGGERPLVDRGVHAEPFGEAIEAGTGPAINFARAGFAGVSVDGPHGGLRNITHGDEQLLVYNFLNPLAMRDNIRQSSLEIILLAHIVENISIESADCPGVQTSGSDVVFDLTKMALMGHSTGATIAQPALALEPRFRAAVLSGAGGSWLENIVYKKSPIEVRPIAELLLEYGRYNHHLHEHDPVLSLLQWAGEPSDAPVFNRYSFREQANSSPPHVLMLQGIVDTYILPPIANATSLSLRLDLAGDPLDADHPELQIYRPLEELLYLSGRRKIDLPAGGNVVAADNTSVTAVVVQHPEGPVEDGHEVVFQTEAPKHQYRCFLETFAVGIPRVPVAEEIDSDCD